MEKIFLFSLFLVFNFSTISQQSVNEGYIPVIYNIENLFDVEGEAVFNDYKLTDRNGTSEYTKKDVLTKIQNAIRVLRQYNEGKGPGIIAMLQNKEFIEIAE